MIENIEQFRSELQLGGLVNEEIAMNGKIPLGGTETSQEISWCGPLPQRIECIWIKRWFGERGWVKRLPTRVLRPKQVKGLSRHYIGPNIRDDCSEGQVPVREFNGRGGECKNDILERPASQNRGREGIDLRGRD